MAKYFTKTDRYVEIKLTRYEPDWFGIEPITKEEFSLARARICNRLAERALCAEELTRLWPELDRAKKLTIRAYKKPAAGRTKIKFENDYLNHFTIKGKEAPDCGDLFYVNGGVDEVFDAARGGRDGRKTWYVTIFWE